MTVPESETLTYRRSAEALSAEVGDDVVALHVGNGHCFGMEQISAAVWNLLEQPATLEQICSILIARYEVAAETCRTEVATLLRQLQREGLVETD